MRAITLFQLFLFILTLYHNESHAIIISPCKVQNLITQPSYGTSLKTKGLVQIVQLPPVFIQNVMIGICENHNQNVSTGKAGEFYSCQQRYSIVEVFIADTSYTSASKTDTHQKPQPDSFNSNIKFVRESVIIESGCDFTFNLIPLMAVAQGETPQGSPAIPKQQRMFLRSPYHQTIPARRPPPQKHVDSSTAATPATYQKNPPTPTPITQTTSHPPPPPTKQGHDMHTHARANENINNSENESSEGVDDVKISEKLR